jgi:hypothetical protein
VRRMLGVMALALASCSSPTAPLDYGSCEGQQGAVVTTFGEPDVKAQAAPHWVTWTYQAGKHDRTRTLWVYFDGASAACVVSIAGG